MTDKTIKSVRRVFEVLELFYREQRPLSAKEISISLDYPLTSSHALLKSMSELGYLDFFSQSWSYVPAGKITEIVRWVEDSIGQELDVLNFVAALNQATRETVNVSRQMYDHVKIVHGLETLHTVGISVKMGTMMPIMQSLTGLVSLCNHNRVDLEHVLNGADKSQRKLFGEVLDELEECGSVCRCDIFVQGIGAVCVPVITSTQDVVVVGVVGPSDRLEAHQNAHRLAITKLAREFNIRTAFKLKKPRVVAG